jgi:polar amino acid transport system substrate-binding protein
MAAQGGILMIRNGLRSGAVLAAGLALALSLAACGEEKNTGGGGGPTPTTAADPALVAKVPAGIKADGKIKIGTDATYPPSEFTENGKVVGFDVDLFDAVAKKLGLTTEWTESKFGDIIPGIESGKYELGVSSFTINDERKQKSLMVSYFSAGTQWATQKGNPKGVKADDACGKKIAVQKDTVQVDDLKARSKKCTDAGKPAITMDEFVDQTAATLAVSTGKNDAMLADSPVCAYAVKKTNGQLELLGDIYDSAPYGAVVAKDQMAFAEAIRDALKALKADGSYTTILTKWGVEAGGLTTDAAINP